MQDQDNVDKRFDAYRLVEAAPGALVQMDAQSRIVYLNPAAERLLRRSAESVLGRRFEGPIWENADAEGEPVDVEHTPSARALRGEEVRDFEMSTRDPATGATIPVLVSAAPLRDSAGRIDGAVLKISDFSGLKHTRDELTESRERMAFALAAAGMVAWDWDPVSGQVTHTTDVNHNLKDGRVEQRDAFEAIMHPDDQERVRATFDRAFKKGEDYICEYRLTPYAGVTRWVISQGRVNTGPRGERRMSGVIADITERKEAELGKRAAQDALAESERRLRLALEGTHTGIYDIDLDTGEGMWSQESYDMLGVTPTPDFRAHFSMWVDRLHPDDRGEVLAAHMQAEATLGRLRIEYRILRGDTGEERWLSTYGAILREEGGQRRSVGIVLDITDRRRAEAREKLLMREVDHRAKNVLAVVQSIIQLTPQTDAQAFVQSVRGRVAAIGRVQTLLSHNRWQAASVSVLIENELAPFRAGGRVRVSGDDVAISSEAAQAVGMIVHELATNAAKYGALAQPEGRIDISIHRMPTGMSLDWTERSPIAPTPSGKPGFGTRLIRELAERQLDGEAKFEWREQGLAAHLEFRAVLSSAALAPPLKDAVAGVDNVRLDGHTFLVVEDDGLVCMALQEELEARGAKVCACPTIQSALNYLAEETPHFAVLDVNVRGQTITSVARALAARSAPFIYATGYSDDLTELPPARVIRKPYDPPEVSAIVREMLSLRSA